MTVRETISSVKQRALAALRNLYAYKRFYSDQPTLLQSSPKLLPTRECRFWRRSTAGAGDIRSFPVLTERSLPSAARTWYGVRRRPESDLPGRPPGTLRVYEVDGRHVAESGPPVIRARSVALVDLRPRTLSIDVDLRPPPGARSCVLRVGFRCQVTDPELVASCHLDSLFPELDSWLGQNQRLRWLAAEGNLDRLDDTYLLINQRILAQYRTMPPEVPGVGIRLVSVRVTVS
jgi:hypothetical protein